jgi:hypothetical protein
MNYSVLDHLEILINKDSEERCEKLTKEGVLDEDGSINANKLNLMIGAFVSYLLDSMQEADMNLKEVIEHFKELHTSGDVKAMYYLLYIIFEALEIELPYLFLAVSGKESMLSKYMDEFLLDFEDCLIDM